MFTCLWFLIHLWIKSFHNTEPVGTFSSILIHSHHNDVSQVNYCFLSRFKSWASCHNWYLNFICILGKEDANLLNSPDTVQSLSSLQDQLVQRHSIHTMDTDVPHGQVNLNSTTLCMSTLKKPPHIRYWIWNHNLHNNL